MDISLGKATPPLARANNIHSILPQVGFVRVDLISVQLVCISLLVKSVYCCWDKCNLGMWLEYPRWNLRLSIVLQGSLNLGTLASRLDYLRRSSRRKRSRNRWKRFFLTSLQNIDTSDLGEFYLFRSWLNSCFPCYQYLTVNFLHLSSINNFL